MSSNSSSLVQSIGSTRKYSAILYLNVMFICDPKVSQAKTVIGTELVSNELYSTILEIVLENIPVAGPILVKIKDIGINRRDDKSRENLLNDVSIKKV